MALFIATLLITLAILATMLARQARVLASGDVETAHIAIIATLRLCLRRHWHCFVEWFASVRKEGSRHLALILARLAHAIGLRVRKLIVLLHRHGRHQ